MALDCWSGAPQYGDVSIVVYCLAYRALVPTLFMHAAWLWGYYRLYRGWRTPSWLRLTDRPVALPVCLVYWSEIATSSWHRHHMAEMTRHLRSASVVSAASATLVAPVFQLRAASAVVDEPIAHLRHTDTGRLESMVSPDPQQQRGEPKVCPYI